LQVVLKIYTEERGLGIVLGSRTAVEITPFRGRLPDLLFVREDRMQIVQQKAVCGPPDLVIEVISPGDRPSDIIALETDYRSVGVREIVFLDQRSSRARVLRLRGDGYVEEELTEGVLTLETMADARLELAWFFEEPRPGLRETADALLHR